MCIVVAPAIAMAIAAASTVAATAASVAAMQQQANAQQSAANYQAQVARNNQVIANQNAEAATAAGQSAEQAERMKGGLAMGAQRAALAANGIDPNSGSALDLQSDTAMSTEMNALTVRNNAARTAYNYQVQGLSQQAQAGLDVMQGQQAQTAAQFGMASSILGSASSLAGKWSDYNIQTANTNALLKARGGGGQGMGAS